MTREGVSRRADHEVDRVDVVAIRVDLPVSTLSFSGLRWQWRLPAARSRGSAVPSVGRPCGSGFGISSTADRGHHQHVIYSNFPLFSTLSIVKLFKQ